MVELVLLPFNVTGMQRMTIAAAFGNSAIPAADRLYSYNVMHRLFLLATALKDMSNGGWQGKSNLESTNVR